jgi:hypothetical protein
MAPLHLLGMFTVMVLGACAAVAPLPGDPPKAPVQAQATPKPSAATPAPASGTAPPAAAPKTAAPVAAPGTTAPKSAAPTAAPKPASSAAARAPAPPPAAIAKAAAPAPLDLKTLEQRLKATSAIGVMTKLSLKNQVDDLVEKFRDYYQGRLAVTLAELRRPYDLLVMKVLALLQDGDPALARAIHASREAIWGILADRSKFEKLSP